MTCRASPSSALLFAGDLYPSHSLAYPNVTGRPLGKDEYMPNESSGNMIIMALAYAQAAHDTTQLERYVDLLDQWGGFLVEHGLFPQDQFSTDDFAGTSANLTNMVVKSLVAIEAMAVVSDLLGRVDKAIEYRVRYHLVRMACPARRSHRGMSHAYCRNFTSTPTRPTALTCCSAIVRAIRRGSHTHS